MKPQLLITTSTLPNDEKDPEPRFVADLAVGLSRHFEVCVLAPRNPGTTPTHGFGSIEVRHYPYAPLRAWETLTYPGATLERLREKPLRWGLTPLLLAGLYREMRRLLAERNFVCVHAHGLVPQATVQALMPPSTCGTPYIAIAHGADVYAMNGALGSAMLRTAVRRALGIVGVSHALITTLRRRFTSEMAGRPTSVIASGVDTEKFTPALRSDDWPAIHSLSRPLIIYVGRLAEKKGIEFLLTAMATEPLRSLRASLAIVGQGSSEGRLKRLVGGLRLGDQIRFLPACDHSILGQHIAAADVLCLPSTVAASGDQEGRPTVLAEAAACGIPVVASDVGGVREWIDDGLNGLVVPPADPPALAKALAGLLTRPECLRRMGHAARKKALETSWLAIANRYAEFTMQVMARAANPPEPSLTSVE